MTGTHCMKFEERIINCDVIHTFAFDRKNIIVNTNIFLPTSAVTWRQDEASKQHARVCLTMIERVSTIPAKDEDVLPSILVFNYGIAFFFRLAVNLWLRENSAAWENVFHYFSFFKVPRMLQFSHHLITFNRKWWIYRCIKFLLAIFSSQQTLEVHELLREVHQAFSKQLGREVKWSEGLTIGVK